MSHLRQFYAATFLALALTVSAGAGQMETPNTSQSPSVNSTDEPRIMAVEEDTPTNDASADKLLTEVELSILQALLSVF